MFWRLLLLHTRSYFAVISSVYMPSSYLCSCPDHCLTTYLFLPSSFPVILLTFCSRFLFCQHFKFRIIKVHPFLSSWAFLTLTTVLLHGRLWQIRGNQCPESQSRLENNSTASNPWLGQPLKWYTALCILCWSSSFNRAVRKSHLLHEMNSVYKNFKHVFICIT